MSNNGIRIIHTNSFEKAQSLVKEGWEPVECSFGEEGVALGPLELDHHGEFSGREGVAVRAYRDHFGVLKGRAQFVVTGQADADATFAIAALAGLLPHPSRKEELAEAPDFVRLALTADLTELAILVNAVDIDPIAVLKEKMLFERTWGKELLLFNQLDSKVEDRSAFHSGVDRWRHILGTTAPKALLSAVAVEEAARVCDAREAKVLDSRINVTAVLSSKWGFDVWYADYSPCVLSLSPENFAITIGVESKEKAEKLFGPGGLKKIFPVLGEGWGGREAIGGSPRGKIMAIPDIKAAAKTVERNII